MAERPARERDVEDENLDAELEDDDDLSDDEDLSADEDLAGDEVLVGDDDDEDDEVLGDEEEAETPAATNSEEDDESEEASLDEILAKRAARTSPEEPEDDIMTLVGSEDELPITETLVVRAQPVKDAKEFVCNRCRLVKQKVQLADETRGLCRDCV